VIYTQRNSFITCAFLMPCRLPPLPLRLICEQLRLGIWRRDRLQGWPLIANEYGATSEIRPTHFRVRKPIAVRYATPRSVQKLFLHIRMNQDYERKMRIVHVFLRDFFYQWKPH
jgi:hypothetical protein